MISIIVINIIQNQNQNQNQYTLFRKHIIYINTMCSTLGTIIKDMLLSYALQSKISLSSLSLIVHVPEYKT